MLLFPAMRYLVPILVVGSGGALGSVLRYLLSLLAQRTSVTFPHGTLWANLLGCLVIGIVVALATATESISPAAIAHPLRSVAVRSTRAIGQPQTALQVRPPSVVATT